MREPCHGSLPTGAESTRQEFPSPLRTIYRPEPRPPEHAAPKADRVSSGSPSSRPPPFDAGPAASPPFTAGPEAGAARPQVLLYTCGHSCDAATGSRIEWVPAGAWVREVLAACTECTRKEPLKRLDPELVQRVAEEEWR
jgi:hypothetical protein